MTEGAVQGARIGRGSTAFQVRSVYKYVYVFLQIKQPWVRVVGLACARPQRRVRRTRAQHPLLSPGHQNSLVLNKPGTLLSNDLVQPVSEVIHQLVNGGLVD